MRTPAEQCQREWKRALRNHRIMAEADILMAIARTQIFQLAPQAVVDDKLVRVPAAGGETIPNNLGYVAVEILINLDTATKEAVGNSLSLNVYLASGNQFVAGFTWTSYGQQYTVVDPDGTVHVDPDPTLRIPLANLLGQQVYLTYQAHGVPAAGVTVNGLG